MRWRTCVSFFGLAAASSALLGQAPFSAPAPSPYPQALPILTAQADVYAGPSTSYYPTSKLRYGDKVVVLGESKKSPGWLEILPPAGSFSWIDGRHVKLVPGVDKIGIVDAGDPKGSVPVMPGSTVQNKEPNVEISRVPSGTQVLLVDRVQSSNGATWYPIAPIATEVRFLHIDAVRPGSSTLASQPNHAGAWQTGASPTPNPNTLAQLNQDAERAKTAGNVDRARLLYVEALNQTNDPAWRAYLQDQLARLAPASSWSPNPAPANAASYPIPNYPTASAGPFSPASSPGVRPVGAETTARAPTAASVPGKDWSPWGVLRNSTVSSREGAPMYVIEHRDTRQPLMYVTTPPGLSLREYVGQVITVYGTLAYRNDDYIRMQYLIAEQIATPPAGSR